MATGTRDALAHKNGIAAQGCDGCHSGGKMPTITLTASPTNSVLLNFSYRESKRVDESDLFLSNAASTTGSGNDAKLTILRRCRS